MVVVKALMGKDGLGFSLEESLALGFVEDDEGNVKWDDKVEQFREIEINPIAYALLQQGLKKLEAQPLTEGGGISLETMDTYKRFVIDKPLVETKAD